ncbi:pantoate--beta-alanine ligase [Thalassolituus oleivorans]|jgi:pantoate--beta-alanine ligase|uniref:Pantothenate synthetase n=1 Tax=Thalassolituus oleivorans MIL-1 TaxID=1298593 RepID=M5E7J1_9GAMM|nr:pantoate--beta-alanine ligase [Thalassolituus oleivorans]PHQ84091.1 MAG: pantoate--beta-alanine ligase [Thalassobium sp.]AHK14962.1 pantoate--beta-alanine ligase [Thalassolituus oleivorans R6-15]MCA6127983.1 pantoate--beta-alanine ligase [Thalassolituus oleivorans 4BN06-13]MDF1641211.1 pantoate--beta-alanine ligase [Thalassolituus oleivorans]CCU73400.1 pantoate--beta-alanine ligase [Thalassolituus oleivorans MIL-1]
MITVHTVAELREHVANARRSGQRVGFVPTMGNLHAGHISLIDRARSECEFVVASIFVNPLQFNDKSDLQRYPRTLPDDQQKLAQAQCNLLFAPNVEEMYPNGQESQSIVHVPVVSEGLCGGSRPGHFDGVSTVVTKLFNQVLADKAFFGEKDFQQVAVIRKMVNDLCMPIEVVTVPTARAEDGLALSSRNGYLSTEERALATGLYQTLNDVIAALNAGAALNSTLNKAEQDLEKRGFKPDYIEVRRSKDLAPATTGDDEIVVLGAAFLGSARLIDNIAVTLNRKID